MGAIGAILSLSGEPIDGRHLSSMAEALHPYGPDGTQFHNQDPIGLVSTVQHFTPEDRFDESYILGHETRFQLAMDGRIDNRPDLARSLGIDLKALASMSDRTLFYRAFERWGADCAHHIVGEFAAIAWDSAERQLTAITDHFALRPLVYHVSPKMFSIASMPKALYALPWVERRLNQQKFADYLVLNFGDGEATFYEGIKRLTWAKTLRVRSGLSPKISRYWSPSQVPQVRYRSDAEYAEALREHLDVAVGAQLRSSRPVGAFMTGGLDSSSVSVVAAKHLSDKGHQLPVFTAVPESDLDLTLDDGLYPDEAPLVEAISRKVSGLDLNLVEARGRGLFHDLDDALRFYETPARNANHQFWHYALFDAARSKGIGVMLSGFAGNMTVSYGWPTLFPSLFLKGRWARLVQELRAYRPDLTIAEAFDHLVVTPLLNKSRIYQSWKLGRHQPWAAFSPISDEFAKAHNIELGLVATGAEQNRSLINHRWLREQILTGDAAHEKGMSRAGIRAMFGIDVRDPTLDRRVVEFCLGVPEDQHVREGETRWLIRRAMARELPDKVLNNDLRGQQAPDQIARFKRDSDLIKSELAVYAQDDFLSRALDMPALLATFSEPGSEGDGSRSAFEWKIPLAITAGRFYRHITQ